MFAGPTVRDVPEPQDPRGVHRRPGEDRTRAGARFEAFGGALTGTVLQVVPHRLIVQSWRSTHFAKRDVDWTLALSFVPFRKGGRIELTHVNVADRDIGGVSEGWSKYYFLPWRAYLAGKSN